MYILDKAAVALYNKFRIELPMTDDAIQRVYCAALNKERAKRGEPLLKPVLKKVA